MGAHPACFFINRACKVATLERNPARKYFPLSCASFPLSRTNWRALAKIDKKTGQYITQEGQGFPSQVIAPDVRAIAATFIALYDAREKADYDDAATVQHTEALAAVQQVELAFQSWLTVQTDASAITFLQELLCRSIMKR
jgi:hypothetical protein